MLTDPAIGVIEWQERASLAAQSQTFSKQNKPEAKQRQLEEIYSLKRQTKNICGY